MNIMRMMKFAVALNRTIVSSKNVLSMPRKYFYSNSKWYGRKAIANVKIFSMYDTLLMGSLRLPLILSSSSSANVPSSVSSLQLRIAYKRKGNGSSKSNYHLIPLLALALFENKKEKEDNEHHESQLVTMIKLGILALQRGELNKAEQLLHVALKTAQEAQNGQAVTYIFDLLANLAYQREEYSKAENLFKDVLKRMFADGMAEDDNAVVEVSLKLASVYASRGDYEKAVQGFHFCIATQEEKIKKYGESNVDEDTSLLWAMSMDWYARFLLNIREYELAKKHFIKAFEMSERVQGLKHPQTAVLLNDIGSVCSLQKNYSEAVSYLERAIDAAKESQSPDIGSFYVNLGAVYLQQGMLLEADKNCKIGLSLARKSKNEEAIEEATACLKEIKTARDNSKKN